MDKAIVTIEFGKLAKELNEIDKDYNYVYSATGGKTHHGSQGTCEAIIIKDNKYNQQLYIMRESMWYGRSSNKAIRIYSDEWHIKASQFRRDFGAKGLAKGLHKRCLELLSQLERKGDGEVDINKKRDAISAKAKKIFPLAEITFHGYHRTTTANVKLGAINLTTEDGDNFYIASVKSALTKDNMGFLKPFFM